MKQTTTRREDFETDPRVKRAKALLAEAAAHHASRLEGPRPGDPGREVGYAETLAAFSELRGGPLFYPYLGSGFGDGPLVELADGAVKFDLICGIGVHVLGHGDAELRAALVDAALEDTVMQGNLQQTGTSVDFARELLELAQRGDAPLRHVFLTTSGAMANENALKLAFHRHRDRGADRILAFEHAFAGRTLALSRITDNPAYRVGLPDALAVDFVPFHDANDPDGSRDHALDTLRAHLDRHPGRHAAMVFELVQGEGGYYPGDRRFFEALLEELRARDVSILFDEIQTFGRTPAPFAFQHFGLDDYAEVVTVGKASQVCATLFDEAHRPGPGLVSQTFTGSTSAIAAGLHIVRRFASGDLFGDEGHLATLSRRFVEGFEAIAERHPDWLSGPFGLGAMLAFTPFDGSKTVTRRLLDALFARGVIAFSTGGAVSRVRFLPPMAVLSHDDVARVLGILEEALADVARDAAGED